MAETPALKAVTAQQGRSLYLIVRDAIREAVDAGKFKPGERLPSTKELSQQLEVSLVTAHRALQELVAIGVLQRAQGRGTFVHPRYFDRKLPSIEARVGLFFH
ncbi:MAG TPA: GntR family transcriptional regulator, partial [Tepidisphaeraceae bacterium]|nr:GntR family transcriptional regulator [Tepidisphaeraceae bacterium]